MAVVLLRARRRNQKLEFHSDRLLVRRVTALLKYAASGVRRRGQSCPPLIQDGGGGGGANARAAGLVNFQHLGERADAAGGFDANFLGEMPAHQGDVREGVAGGGKPGGGLDEIDFGAFTAAAGDDLQFVGEVGV